MNFPILVKTVAAAQVGHYLLDITYLKISTKMRIRRTVEPYEAKQETRKDGQTFFYLYCYDDSRNIPMNKRHIKKFRADQFFTAKVHYVKFKPKFSIVVWK